MLGQMPATPSGPESQLASSSREGLLVHFMERELLRMGGVDRGPVLLDQFEELTRIAILFSPERAIIPAPSYFETDEGSEIFRRFAASRERGQLGLIGSGARPRDYIEHKGQHWANDPLGPSAYVDEKNPRRNVPLEAWNVKTQSTDELLERQWRSAVEDGTHPFSWTWLDGNSGSAQNQDLVYELPAALDGTALLLDNIIRHLPRSLDRVLSPRDREGLRLFLARGFFESYLGDRWGLLGVSPGYDIRAIAPPGVPVLSVHKLKHAMEPLNQSLNLTRELLKERSTAEVAELADTGEWRTLAGEILKRTEPYPEWSVEDLLAVRRVKRRRTSSLLHGRRAVVRLRAYIVDLLNALATDWQPGGSRLVRHSLPIVSGLRIKRVEKIEHLTNIEAPSDYGKPAGDSASED